MVEHNYHNYHNLFSYPQGRGSSEPPLFLYSLFSSKML